MKIGIGLPNAVPGVAGTTLVDWAKRAEGRGFASLATIDRIAYPSHDSLMSLAAAAGATSRIELHTNILLAASYPAVQLAKSVASIDQLSGGRFSLGLALGGRADDYALAGVDFGRRGEILDEELELLHQAWRGGAGGRQRQPRRSRAGERVPRARHGRWHQRSSDPPHHDVRRRLDHGGRDAGDGGRHGGEGQDGLADGGS